MVIFFTKNDQQRAIYTINEENKDEQQTNRSHNEIAHFLSHPLRMLIQVCRSTSLAGSFNFFVFN